MNPAKETAPMTETMGGRSSNPPSRRGSSDMIGSSAASAPVGAIKTAATTVMIGSKPTLLTVPPMRFLIMDAPRQANLHLYIRECKKHNVTDIVRVCEPTYHGSELENAGIALHEMAYEDGHSPPKEVIERWLTLVEERFYSGVGASKGGGGSAKDSSAKGGKSSATNGSDGTAASSAVSQSNAADGVGQSTSAPTIAVHCVAGLGRAPVLVAIALIEFANMDPVEAVTLIRRHRRGAINEKQLIYLEGYKKQYRRSSGTEAACCVIL